MRNDVELTRRQRQLLIRFILVMIVVVVALFFTTLLSSWQARQDVTATLRAGCERSRIDRADNAAAWTAHRIYITKVTSAKSVQEDVKRAARAANKTYVRVSASLTKRALVQCEEAFPDPPFLKLFGVA